MPADVNLNIDINKKGEGDKEAAAGLELVAKAADDATDELRALDRKLLETRAAMVAAGKEFARTGDISPFKQVRKDLNELTTVRKTLAKFTDDVGKDLVKVGEDAGKGFISRFGSALSSGVDTVLESTGNAIKGSPWISAGIAGGILIGAPVIGGALTAAVGGGALAAGLVLAGRDPAVKQAWRTFGESGLSELSDAASVFVQPAIRGAEQLRAALHDITPEIRGDFALLVPAADHLFAGAAGFVRELQPGIDALVRGSTPLLRDLGDELPRFANAISTAFKDISSAGAGGREALLDVIHQTEGAIVVLGKLLEITERVYSSEKALAHLFTGDFAGAQDRMAAALTTTKDAAVLIGPAGKQAFDAVNAAIIPVGRNVQLTKDQFQTLQTAISATATTADTLAEQMTTKILTATLGLDQATLAFAQSQTSLGQVLQGNHHLQDISTLKGQELRAAVLGVVQSNIAEYQSLVAAKGSAEEASAAYDANTKALEQQLTKAGLTKGEVDKLIGAYRGVPANVNTEIQTKGLQEAINSLDDAIRKANHLDGRVAVLTIEERHRTVYDNSGSPPPSAYFRGLAKGGIIAGASGFIANGPTFLIGERTVPEVAIPAPNSGISQARADMLLGTAASYWGRRVTSAGGGGGGVTINLTVNAGMGADGQQIGQQIVKVLNQQLRTNPAAAATIKAALG